MSSYENLNEWESIQETDVNLKWTKQNGFPVVRATAKMPFHIDSISKIIEDVKNYPNVFRRIHEILILDKNIIHIILDMPFLLSPNISRFINKISNVDNDIHKEFFN